MNTYPQNAASPARLVQFGFAYAVPLIIGAAVNNKVFDTLANGAKSAEEVSRETGASIRGLRAVMNALVALDLLAKNQKGEYALTPESEAFLVSTKPGTLAGFFSLNMRSLIPHWLQLDEVVRTGRPSEARNKEGPGSKFYLEFVETIGPMNYGAAQVLASHLKLARSEGETRVLDLGAGSGVWGIALAQEFPRVRVTAVDWPGVIPATRRFTEKFGVAGSFRFLEGDLFDVPFGEGYDVAILGHVLQCEGAERSRELLRKTFDALKSDGAIAIGESLVDDGRTGPLPSLMLAVQLLVNTERGDTFSFSEIKSWLENAGFKDSRPIDIPGTSPLVVATKP